MKYIIALCDGMSGRPLEELGGKTTMEVADKKTMNALAKTSEIGTASMVPQGMAPGSDTANLSVLGYNPQIYYTGRSPLEALSIGVDMAPTDVSFRCNLVTISEQEIYEECIMIDHSSDEISTEDAATLLEALKEGLKKEGYQFYKGISYRHLLIQTNGTVLDLIPPHDILTKQIGKYLPQDSVLRDMMVKSYEILNAHPLNEQRKQEGKRPANSAWFWGAGKKPALTSFEEKTGKKGIMISAVDLLKGIAVGAEMDNAEIEGATGGLHTNYVGKAEAAVAALTQEGYDFVYIHIEAPDEMGHQGRAQDKIKAIENIDEHIIKAITEQMEKLEEPYRMLILPDHPTPVQMRTHTGDPVPYLLYDSRKPVDGIQIYNEEEAAKSLETWPNGYQLIDHLLELR